MTLVEHAWITVVAVTVIVGAVITIADLIGNKLFPSSSASTAKTPAVQSTSITDAVNAARGRDHYKYFDPGKCVHCGKPLIKPVSPHGKRGEPVFCSAACCNYVIENTSFDYDWPFFELQRNSPSFGRFMPKEQWARNIASEIKIIRDYYNDELVEQIASYPGNYPPSEETHLYRTDEQVLNSPYLRKTQRQLKPYKDAMYACFASMRSIASAAACIQYAAVVKDRPRVLKEEAAAEQKRLEQEKQRQEEKEQHRLICEAIINDQAAEPDQAHPKHKCYQCNRPLPPNFPELLWQNLSNLTGPFFHTEKCKQTAENRHANRQDLLNEYNIAVREYEDKRAEKEREKMDKARMMLEREERNRADKERKDREAAIRHAENLEQKELDRIQREKDNEAARKQREEFQKQLKLLREQESEDRVYIRACEDHSKFLEREEKDREIEEARRIEDEKYAPKPLDLWNE